MFGSQPNGYMGLGDQSMLQAQPDTAPQKAGMFGGGNNWLSVLAAGLSGYNARVSPQVHETIMSMIQAKQQQQAEEAQYQRRHDQELQDQKDLLNFKSTLPVNNDTVADYNFWKQTLPPEQFQQWLQNKINPPQYMDVPGVGLVQVPRAGSAPAAPQAPVGTLRDYGGPASQAPGGFPR